jgi:hypothetical protein
MKFWKAIALYGCALGMALIVGLALAPKLRGQGNDAKPITVIVGKVGSHVSYRVNSRQVEDILRGLAESADLKARNQLVNVYIDSRLPFDEMSNIDGVADKVPLTNLRFFVFAPGDTQASEIKEMPPVPFPGAQQKH